MIILLHNQVSLNYILTSMELMHCGDNTGVLLLMDTQYKTTL